MGGEQILKVLQQAKCYSLRQAADRCVNSLGSLIIFYNYKTSKRLL